MDFPKQPVIRQIPFSSGDTYGVHRGTRAPNESAGAPSDKPRSPLR